MQSRSEAGAATDRFLREVFIALLVPVRMARFLSLLCTQATPDRGAKVRINLAFRAQYDII